MNLAIFVLASRKCECVGFCAALSITRNKRLHVAVARDHMSAITLVDWAGSASEWKALKPRAPQTDRGFGMCMCLAAKQSSRDVDTDCLIAAYEDGSLVTWDLASTDMIHRVQVFNDTVMAVDYDSSTNKGVCASVGSTIHMWTLQPNLEITLLGELNLQNPGVAALRFRPSDARLFVAACWDGRARLFSAKTRKLLAVLSFHRESVQCVAFSAADSLAIGSKDGAITVWDLYN